MPLTVLRPPTSAAFSAPHLLLVAAALLAAVRLAPDFGRPGFPFSVAVLGTVGWAALVREILGFKGDARRELNGFGGDPRVGRAGDCGRVRELADLGERIVDGLGGRRELAFATTLVRFLGLATRSSCTVMFP